MAWISATRQRWKLYAFYALTFVCFVLQANFMADVNDTPFLPVKGFMAATAFIAAGVCAFAWLIVSIRCSACGFRPVWSILRSAPASRWFLSLLALERCPRCAS